MRRGAVAADVSGAEERDSEPRRVLAAVQAVEPGGSSDGAAAPGAGLGGPARRRDRGGRQGAAAVVRRRLGTVADASAAGVRGGVEADAGADGGRTVHSHWAIENVDARIGRLHWVLDVSMDEDQARNRKGNSAACLAVVRRLALNIARIDTGDAHMPAAGVELVLRREFAQRGLGRAFVFVDGAVFG